MLMLYYIAIRANVNYAYAEPAVNHWADAAEALKHLAYFGVETYRHVTVNITIDYIYTILAVAQHREDSASRFFNLKTFTLAQTHTQRKFVIQLHDGLKTLPQ